VGGGGGVVCEGRVWGGWGVCLVWVLICMCRTRSLIWGGNDEVWGGYDE